MGDCAEYRTALEDIIGAYFEHGDGPGLRALLQDANGLLIDNAVSHRHEGWEGPAEACPICRAYDALRAAETRELEAAAEADVLRAQLLDCRGVIREVVARARPLMPFVLAQLPAEQEQR